MIILPQPVAARIVLRRPGKLVGGSTLQPWFIISGSYAPAPPNRCPRNRGKFFFERCSCCVAGKEYVVAQQRVKGGLSTRGACWMGSLELVKDVLPVILQEGRIDRSNTWGSHCSPLYRDKAFPKWPR